MNTLQLKFVSDLGLAAYLSVRGHPIQNVTPGSKGWAEFHFEDTPQMQRDILDYFNKSASVSAAALIESYRSLRLIAVQVQRKREYK